MMSKARYLLAALAAIIILGGILTPVMAAPPQYIGAGPVQIPTSTDEFEQMFPGMWGKVIALMLFVGTFMLVRRKFFEEDRRRARSAGIMGWGIPFIAALLVMVIVGPPLVGMLGIKGGVSAPQANTACLIKGPIKLTVKDTKGNLVTSGKVLLLNQKMTIAEVIDQYQKGKLTDVKEAAVGSDGTIEFDNIAPGTLLLAYLPASYAAGQYEPTLVNVDVQCAYKPNSEYLVTSVNTIEGPKMLSLQWENEVGSSVASYTWKPASYPAELQGFSVKMAAPDNTGHVPYFYLYLNYSVDTAALDFKVGSTTLQVKKISDLKTDDPVEYALRVNAPSGYTYVAVNKLGPIEYGEGKELVLQMSGTFQGNETVLIMPVAFADSQYGDFQMAGFTFTADNTAASPGWG